MAVAEVVVVMVVVEGAIAGPPLLLLVVSLQTHCKTIPFLLYAHPRRLLFVLTETLNVLVSELVQSKNLKATEKLENHLHSSLLCGLECFTYGDQC